MPYMQLCHVGTVLTDREMEIVGLIASGHSNKRIAKDLYISVSTVKSHVHNILTKLRLSSRLGIAIWYMEWQRALQMIKPRLDEGASRAS